MPAFQVRWDSGLQTWNKKVLKETLEKAAVPSANRSAVQQKIGDFWAACMDEKSIDAAGTGDRELMVYGGTPGRNSDGVLTNQHSYAPYRVNNVVSNMREFWQAFGCKKGQRMVRENACRVW